MAVMGQKPNFDEGMGILATLLPAALLPGGEQGASITGVDVVVLLASLVVVLTACVFLGAHHAYGELTSAQVALALSLCLGVAVWSTAEVAAWRLAKLRKDPSYEVVSSTDNDASTSSGAGQPGEVEFAERAAPAAPPSSPNASAAEKPSPEVLGKAGQTSSGDVESAATAAASAAAPAGARATAPAKGAKAPKPSLGWPHDAIPALRAVAELAAILAFVFICDRTDIFQKAPKVVSKTYFWGLWAAVVLASFFTVRELKGTGPLQREQTDEWKGWMQIMFLMYHYFHAADVYAAIRVFIAAYVWMTGYGNFCYYARKDDFSPKRLLHMLFRLNFLGFVACVALKNEYMLYYICAMHTLFTVFVIIALYIQRGLNKSFVGVHAKVIVVGMLTVFLYDGPDYVFRGIFGTLPVVRQLFAFHDPLHPEFTDEMHEWHFRSGLDRFVWIFGMFCAYHIDSFGALLERLEAMPTARHVAGKAMLVAVALVMGVVWWWNVFSLEKRAYNKLHPFTSWFPIAAFLLFRNLVPWLRRRYLFFFAWMGKYTLETYIFQFHIWMKTTGANGSPKHLLEFIPTSTPLGFWLNFALTTAIYVFMSVRFNQLTAVLSDAFVDPALLPSALNFGRVAFFGMLCWFAASGLQAVSYMWA